ncbi:MAG: glycosyltransferase family 2 protein [Anaerolineaceae bacterium]
MMKTETLIRVSVIIPCRNEEKSIFACLDGLNQQNYAMEEVEVIIADGMSTDQTQREIKRFMEADQKFSVIVIDNPEKTIPSALNRAIEASQGDFIIRMDAHSRPHRDYIRLSMANLENNIADNVGGVWKIRPGNETWIARSIAEAASHKLGVGNALYRYATGAEYVDTVPFGAFRKSLFEKIGKFDEDLFTNEDYEFNARILRGGGKVFLDPAIQCEYFARPTLKSLARQYWRYGFWKLKMLRKYPTTLKMRQLLPPVFVLSLVVTGLIAVSFGAYRWLFGAEMLLYLLTLCLASIPAARKGKEIRFILGIPLAIATMHLSWGSGFLLSIFSR